VFYFYKNKFLLKSVLFTDNLSSKSRFYQLKESIPDDAKTELYKG